MRYFHRAHCTPDEVLQHAERFFPAQGLARQDGGPDAVRYRDSRGLVEITVEVEGGHYTRVTVATGEVGEAEIDRIAKRFLAELHGAQDPSHKVRGAY